MWYFFKKVSSLSSGTPADLLFLLKVPLGSHLFPCFPSLLAVIL